MRVVLSVVLALPLAFAACKSSEPVAKKCEGCDKMKASNGWCDGCSKGFADGKEVKCKSCHAAMTGAGGWCESCNKGYMAGKETTHKCCAEAAAKGVPCPT